MTGSRHRASKGWSWDLNPGHLCSVRGRLWSSLLHVGVWEKASGPGLAGSGRVSDSLSMAFSLRKQLMKPSKSMIMSSFAYLATNTCVTLLFTLMPGERGVQGRVQSSAHGLLPPCPQGLS